MSSIVFACKGSNGRFMVCYADTDTKYIVKDSQGIPIASFEDVGNYVTISVSRDEILESIGCYHLPTDTIFDADGKPIAIVEYDIIKRLDQYHIWIGTINADGVFSPNELLTMKAAVATTAVLLNMFTF